MPDSEDWGRQLRASFLGWHKEGTGDCTGRRHDGLSVDSCMPEDIM